MRHAQIILALGAALLVLLPTVADAQDEPDKCDKSEKINRVLVALEVLPGEITADVSSQHQRMLAQLQIYSARSKRTLHFVPIPPGSTSPLTFGAHVQSGKRRDSVVNGTLIGAAVGAGYGIAAVVAIESGGDNGRSGTRVAVPLLSAAIGAGVGALIDLWR